MTRTRADGCCAFCGRDLEDCRCGARRAAGNGAASIRRLDGQYRRAAAPTGEDMRAYALEAAQDEPEVVAARADRMAGTDALGELAAVLEADAAELTADLQAEAGAVAVLAVRLAARGATEAEVAQAVALATDGAEVADVSARPLVTADALPSRRSRVRVPAGARFAVVAVAGLLGLARVAGFAAGALAAVLALAGGWACEVAVPVLAGVVRAQVGGHGRHGSRRPGAVRTVAGWVAAYAVAPVAQAVAEAREAVAGERAAARAWVARPAAVPTGRPMVWRVGPVEVRIATRAQAA